MIEAGSDINTQDIDGNSPLHWVVSEEFDTIMNELIEKGADFHIKNKLRKEPCDLLDERSKNLLLQFNLIDLISSLHV